MTTTATEVPAIIRNHRKSRVWFWKPQWYWIGWQTFSPIHFNHDEYSRNTLLLGWTFTGRIIIALRYCGDVDCYEQTVAYIKEYESD